MRNGRSIATEIHAFAQRAPDGRLRRIEQLTRQLPANGDDVQPGDAFDNHGDQQ
jgi:hypothetical protein